VPNMPEPEVEPILHTLESIASALGASEPGLIEAVLDGAAQTELVELGRQIETDHVVSDAERIYRTAFDFWGRATDAQKDRLRGFSPELLCLATHNAIALGELKSDSAGNTKTEIELRAVLQASAQKAFDEGLAMRDQAERVLQGVASKDATLRVTVENAVGTAESSTALASGLRGLAKVGARFLTHDNDAIAARAKLMRLDAGYVASLNDSAKLVEDTAKKAAGRTGGKRVTQGALDHADGVQLHLMAAIVNAFEAAHDIDPTIPRLVRTSTRRLYTRRNRKVEKAPVAPAEGLPVAPVPE